MARCEDWRYGNLADPLHLAVLDHSNGLDRRKRDEVSREPCLWIVRRIDARSERLRAGRAYRHRRAREPLKCRNAGRVIEVRMRIDDQLDVLGLETERAHVRINLRRGLLEAAIEKDVSSIACHKDG